MKYSEFKSDPKRHSSLWVSKTFFKNPGAAKPFARSIGKSRDLIHAYGDPDDQNHLHLYNLPTLIDETGDVSILEEIAGMFGYRLVPVNGNVSETLRAIAKAIEDNK
jgi:hypothetical protein